MYSEMKVGDLVRNKRNPHAGIGVVVKLMAMEPGYQGRWSCAIAVFPDHGEQIIYRDEAEIINESR